MRNKEDFETLNKIIGRMNNEKFKFFKVSHGGGYDIKVIVANNQYEALGYYALEVQKDTWCEDVDPIEEMSPDEEIEVSCVGFPIYETLEEMAKKKEIDNIPQVICGLIE